MTDVRATATSDAARAAIDVTAAAQLACLLEASAPKPGNVSPGRHVADACYEDFLASAAAIGRPLADAGRRPVGTTVRLAVEATGCWTRSNTNLGIVLLLAPLARAALEPPRVRPTAAAHTWMRLRGTLRHVLETTSVDDARNVYAAIRRAAPGGLGRADLQDVADDPTMTLLDVMRLAADRDAIAREYATAFEVTFEAGAPVLDLARRDGLSWNDAIVETYLTLLATTPDTHVARRHGAAAAAEVSRRARTALAAGGTRSGAGWRAIDEMDLGLRNAGHTINPGATADLTAAAIFVVLIGGGWAPPLDASADRTSLSMESGT
jgi:triphosphoribosyl-dephospho-CoA synthase